MLGFEKNSGMDKPIILYGVGMYAEIAHYVIKYMWNREVIFCVDRTYTECVWGDVQVFEPKILEKYLDANILICGANSFKQISDYLLEIGAKHIYNIIPILEIFRTNKNTVISEMQLVYGDLNVDEIVERYNFNAGVRNGYDEKVNLSYCVLCVTNKCSLNCEKCAAFIPYYNYKEHVSLDKIIEPFARFLGCVDNIAELELMGGEPFLHPQLDKIIEWCDKQEKINAIKIVSNATVMPTERIKKSIEKCKKIQLVFDDYGENSIKKNELIEWALEKGIRYSIQKLSTWYDIEPIKKRNQTESKLKEIFSACVWRNCVGVTNGRLFHCNVMGHLDELNMVPDFPTEYIDLTVDDVCLREKIKNYLKKDYLEYCDYCGMVEKREVPVAKQKNSKR